MNATPTPPMQQRIFLVVVDETEEMRVALRYAALRARHTGGRVALLVVMEPSELKQWAAVDALQREESRAAAEQLVGRLSAEVNEIAGNMPVVFIREGLRSDELLGLLSEEPSISVLVLAAGSGPDGPGPLIDALLGKLAGTVRVPITIVPGSLTEAQLAALA
jgi:nucleotide-binding universal stress UspA family protein